MNEEYGDADNTPPTSSLPGSRRLPEREMASASETHAPLALASPLNQDSRAKPVGSSSPGAWGESSEASVSSYNASKRAEVDQQLHDAFRVRQQQRKARQVQSLVLGKGLGAPAEATLVDGYYNPQTVLEPLTKEEKDLWETINLRDIPLTSGFADDNVADDTTREGEDSNAREVKSLLSGVEEKPEDAGESPFLDKFRCTYSPVTAILQARAEIEANMETAEGELDRLCSPFLFSEVLESLVTALGVLEEGSTTAHIALPTCCREEPSLDPRARAAQRTEEKENPLLLVGAEAVLSHLREHLLPVAYALVPLIHTAQWVVQYTVAFLRSLAASTEEEAEVRVELLARCVRLVGRTEHFSSTLLLLESKMEEYDAFRVLQDSAEAHIGTLLDDVEKTLDSVRRQPYPSRRARLRLLEKGIKQKLQRALLFLNEIDYHWTPNVRLHAEWKANFLSSAFYRIHCVISPSFAQCLMGFIDDALYKLVSDSRVSGRMVGASPVQPKVPIARQVEYERVTEGLSLQQIGMQVKGNASIVVGAQICMGSRYVLRQSTHDFDKSWGFAMDEPSEAPSRKDVERFMSKVASKARSKANATSAAPGTAPTGKMDPSGSNSSKPPPRRPINATFLTQEEYE